jgi:hypothetical protein
METQMSISTLESTASVRALDAMGHEEAQRAAGVAQLERAYVAAVKCGRADVLALFAPRKVHRVGTDGKTTPTVAEVLFESFDRNARDGFMQAAMQIILDCANGHATDIQSAAQELLQDAGAKWADNEADFL